MPLANFKRLYDAPGLPTASVQALRSAMLDGTIDNEVVVEFSFDRPTLVCGGVRATHMLINTLDLYSEVVRASSGSYYYLEESLLKWFQHRESTRFKGSAYAVREGHFVDAGIPFLQIVCSYGESLFTIPTMKRIYAGDSRVCDRAWSLRNELGTGKILIHECAHSSTTRQGNADALAAWCGSFTSTLEAGGYYDYGVPRHMPTMRSVHATAYPDYESAVRSHIVGWGTASMFEVQTEKEYKTLLAVCAEVEGEPAQVLASPELLEEIYDSKAATRFIQLGHTPSDKADGHVVDPAETAEPLGVTAKYVEVNGLAVDGTTGRSVPVRATSTYEQEVYTREAVIAFPSMISAASHKKLILSPAVVEGKTNSNFVLQKENNKMPLHTLHCNQLTEGRYDVRI